MKSLILLSCLIAYAMANTIAATGVDIPSTFRGEESQEFFDCIKSHDQDFLAINIFDHIEGENLFFSSMYEKARSAGIKNIHPYVTICSIGGYPLGLIEILEESLPAGFDGIVWINLGQTRNCWYDSPKLSLSYITIIANAIEGWGWKAGIYSSMESWSYVLGSREFSAQYLRNLPLWYRHSDGSQDFDDWEDVKFGGWMEPTIKQYSGNATFCNKVVGRNSYHDL